MTEPSSETPIGQSPPGGGPRKKWNSEAERIADYRRRRKEEAAAQAPASGPDGELGRVPPDRAQTVLAATLDRITGMAGRLREEGAAVAAQVESVIATLADPDTVAATLDACAATAAEQVAVAEARAADADRQRRQAEHEIDDARAAADEAIEAAEALDSQLREAESELAAVRGELEMERAERAADAEAHATKLEAVRAERREALEVLVAEHNQAAAQLHATYSATLDDVRAEHARHVAAATEQAEALTARLAAESAARARAEEAAADLRLNVDRARRETAALRDEVPGLVEAARVDLRHSLGELHAAEVAAAEARGAGQVAQLNGQLEGCRERLKALGETNDDLRAQLAVHRGPQP